jgi:tetratricopeptide (TPR) repeat protein
VLQKDPNDVAARANLATVYRSMGNTEKSLAQYEALVAQQPTSVDYLSALADAYNEAGRYGNAISTAQRLLQVKPGSGSAYAAWAKALEKQGDYKGAIALLEKAKQDPEWRDYAVTEIERQNQLIEIAEQKARRELWDKGEK